MVIILLISVLIILGAVYLDKLINKKININFYVLLFACFLIKISACFFYKGHSTDIGCFSAWSDMIFDGGIGQFYKTEAFTDYPPGYMYILYVIGGLRNIFNIYSNVLLKLPAVICDCLTGVLIYRVSEERDRSDFGKIISVLYMLNPAVILNSSLWGQVDSVYTLFLVIMILLICKKKLIASFYVFAICIFIKPQSLIYTPVLLLSVWENSKHIKMFLKYAINGIGAILFMILLSLPFGIKNVAEQYISTLASYPYMTVNAFNLWGAFDLNWVYLSNSASFIGTVFLVIIVACAVIIFYRSDNDSRYFKTAAFLGFATYMLSTKMHDRYAFAVMAMLAFAFVFSKELRQLVLFMLVSASQFFNTAWVLFIYETDINFYAHSPVIIIASIVNIVLFVYLCYCMGLFKILPLSDKKSPNMNKRDWIIVFVITVVYSCFAFYDLGSTEAPRSFANIYSAEIELKEEKNISSIKLYHGTELSEEGELEVEFISKNEDVYTLNNEKTTNVFYWNEFKTQALAKRIHIRFKNICDVFEIGVFDDKGNQILIKSCTYPELIDEQYMVPERTTFKNSTYFDEIYHARTGYEFLHARPVYEWTHPPLGKVFIALGIRIFGMTPFGWRIVGTLFGVFMIPVIYIISKRLFQSTFIALLGCVMLTFDFMHFAQTRISTIDVYVTFFIMLMYLFMYKYYNMDFTITSFRQQMVPLLLSGIAFGFGVACKWTAVYACAGLALVFFITLIGKYKKDRDFSVAVKTCGMCVIFFILIPVLIYCVSYIPFMRSNDDFSFGAIWENQQSMFAYHGKTVVSSTHPYSSRWFSWPVIYRPIWYYSGETVNGFKEGISSFGNPAVWWLGIPSFFACIYYVIVHKDKKALYVLIGYLSCLLPWVFVERTTYIYHYFPCVIFSVLMTCFIVDKMKKKESVGLTIMIATVFLFIIFYPVISGQPVSEEFVDNMLRWMDSWVLVG